MSCHWTGRLGIGSGKVVVFSCAVLVASAAACDGGIRTTDRNEVAYRSGGEDVGGRTASPPLEARDDVELPLEVEVLWRIGGARDSVFAFGILQPHHVSVDGDGRLVLLDPSGPSLIRVSQEGTLVDSIGAVGAGPGEVLRPIAVTRTPDGGIAVFDRGHGGVVTWSRNGSWVATTPLRGITYWGPGFRVTQNGLLFIAAASEKLDLVRVADRDTTVLASFPIPARTVADFPSCNARELSVLPLLTPTGAWDESNGTVVVTRGATYEVMVHGASGSSLSLIRPLAPRPVSRAMALRATEGWNINGCEPPSDEVVDGAGYAPLFPLIDGLRITPRGEIWVKRAGLPSEPVVIDVFDEHGVYLGTLRDVPFPTAFLDDERFVAIGADEFEVPWVASYRIVR